MNMSEYVAGKYAKVNTACMIWVNIDSMGDSAKVAFRPAPPNIFALLTNSPVKNVPTLVGL